MAGKTKQCTKCGEDKTLAEFHRDNGRKDGRHSICKECRRPAESARSRDKTAKGQELEDRDNAERMERLASDYSALKPEDFDVTIGNDGRVDKRASREKRQEYSRSMGENAQGLHDAARTRAKSGKPIADSMPAKSGTYIAKLSEQERRFGNRKIARSVSLAQAHEALSLDMFCRAADRYLAGKITPTGYATRRPRKKVKRSVCLLLSDLHLGSELSSLDEPMPFRAVEEARRLEYVVRQALDYKPQYRENSELVLMINGDIIEGQLMHDLRAGAPLTEQKVVFWRMFSEIIALAAQQYPSVRVYCQPGNHGRDKVRHPGRATSRKWDGHEWEMYYALSRMGSELKNVTWDIPFRAVTAIDLHGSTLGLTHGDTEVALRHPDKAAEKNAQTFDRINSTRMYGCTFDAWAVGHFHSPRYQPRNPRVVWNGALVPPNGHARTVGYIGEPCGQFLWEAVEGYPVGDLRFIEVGPAQDHDENLGKLIKPFRFTDD